MKSEKIRSILLIFMLSFFFISLTEGIISLIGNNILVYGIGLLLSYIIYLKLNNKDFDE